MTTVCAKQNKTRFPESIRVMVVDDHARVRQGLRLFLSTCPGIEVIAEACDGGEALRRFAETRPDVVVMDLGTPGMDSPVMTLHMKRLRPASQIVALASFRDPDMERRALEAGAAACYVAKDSSTATLLEAIRAAHEQARNGHMTSVQVKSGVLAELGTGVPSDVVDRVDEYDGCIHTRKKSATRKVTICLEGK